MPKVAPEFLGKVAAFRGDLEAHIRLEESRIFPALRSALFDGGAKEKQLRIGAAKLLGPRTRQTRLIRDTAPLIGAALQDTRRVR